MIRLFVILAFFVSGASSLMLEVVWSKALGHVLGNTLEAITTVVAAYMGGLALGASWAGRSGAGQARPVRAYGLLEIGVGVFGLVSPWLIRALEGPLAAAYDALGGAGPAYFLVRFLAIFVLLLIPTTLMGATLPILVAWGSKRADLARVLGTLYAINTAGAVAGTVLSGFILLPAIGLSATAWVAGATSLTLGAIMVILAGRMGESAAAPPAPALREMPAPIADPGARGPEGVGRARLMLVLFGLSGAVSLSTQIAWSRVAGILLGSSVYSFSLVLATFLVGIAAGSALVVPWLTRRGASWRLFAVLQWIAAFGVVYASFRIADAPWDMLTRVVTARGNVGNLWIEESLILAGFMLPACLAFGAIFPVATRLSAFPGDSPSRTTGRAYGWNTLGTISGSLLAGFLLIGAFGMRGTLIGVGSVAVAIGVVAWFAAPHSPSKKSSIPAGAPVARLAVPALAVAGLIIVVAFAPPWNRGLLSIGVFRPLVSNGAAPSLSPEDARRQLRDELSMEDLLSFVEGRQGMVSVHRTRTNPPILALRFNGKTDASTGLDMQTQILLGQVAMMWAADSARVAIVGYGSGVTAGSALTHPLRSADVIEIEPAVLAADTFFRPYNGNPTADPRLKVHIDDGRTFLAHARRPFDVIISEPSNPWLAGVNNLFTVDFYRLVHEHLAPGGVFCQWMQFYEMSDVMFASLARSLHEVFPSAQVFQTGRDLLFVATRDGRPLDLDRVATRLARPAVAKDLARANVHNPADLVALHQVSLAALVARLPEAPLNLDDRPFVEYRAPIDLYRVRPSESPFPEQAMRDSNPVAELGQWTVGVPPLDLAMGVAHSWLEHRNLAAASRWIDALIALDPSRAGPLFESLRAIGRQTELESRIVLARQALQVNDVDRARRILDQLLKQEPGWATALIERARVSMRADSVAVARTLLQRALLHADDDDRYQAHSNLGILAMREGKGEEGLAQFGLASAVRPHEAEAWLYRARVLVQLGRVQDAQVVLDQGRKVAGDPAVLDAAYQQLNATGSLP
ncbi:MAG: fused MFS/spermidine synthase [Candidatus Eisenbacteria bacterium]